MLSRSITGGFFISLDTMSNNERYANGNARRKLRTRLKSEGRGCWICRAFGRPDHIDYDLPARHPLSFEVDELTPVSRYREAGYPSKQACALDYNNVDATHRACNEWRGNKTVPQVLAIANRQRGRGSDLPKPWDF